MKAPSRVSTVEARKLEHNAAQKDHINIRILPTMISGIPLYWALEPECEILMFMWSFGPLHERPPTAVGAYSFIRVWVVVKIRVPFGVLSIRRHLVFRGPKRGP